MLQGSKRGRAEVDVQPRGSAARPRALILEPFLTELGLNAHTDESEVTSLESAGYSVDVGVDAHVTVDSMANLSQYQVIYINTHSGVNQYGEGAIATGEEVDGDPAAEQLIKEGTAMVAAVSGSDKLYYALLSGYFRAHEPMFSPGAVLFINGCSLLRASMFWDALSSRGAGALISWDNPVAPPADSTSAALVLADMSAGRTVREAVNNALAGGYGVAEVEGKYAHLGFRGDGSVSLLHPEDKPSPTATPTVTPTATATELPTATPTLTATLVPTHAPATVQRKKTCGKKHKRKKRCK